MRIFDNMVQKALAMNKHSSEFSVAAQKHANATWAYLIIAGVVWYFFGLLLALVPFVIGVFTAFQSISATIIASRLETIESSPNSLNEDFIKIIHSYGEILENNAPIPGTVADINKLPYSKQEIKNAIIQALKTMDDPKMKEYLKGGYIMLSDWQDGVDLTSKGIDLSIINTNQDTKNIAKSILEQSTDIEQWTAIVEKEQEILKQELKKLGLWE